MYNLHIVIIPSKIKTYVTEMGPPSGPPGPLYFVPAWPPPPVASTDSMGPADVCHFCIKDSASSRSAPQFRSLQERKYSGPLSVICGAEPRRRWAVVRRRAAVCRDSVRENCILYPDSATHRAVLSVQRFWGLGESEELAVTTVHVIWPA